MKFALALVAVSHACLLAHSACRKGSLTALQTNPDQSYVVTATAAPHNEVAVWQLPSADACAKVATSGAVPMQLRPHVVATCPWEVQLIAVSPVTPDLAFCTIATSSLQHWTLLPDQLELREVTIPPPNPPSPGSPSKRRAPGLVGRLSDFSDASFIAPDTLLASTFSGTVWEIQILNAAVTHYRRVLRLPEYAFTCLSATSSRAALGTACGRVLLLRKGGKAATWVLAPAPATALGSAVVATFPGVGFFDLVVAAADGKLWYGERMFPKPVVKPSHRSDSSAANQSPDGTATVIESTLQPLRSGFASAVRALATARGVQHVQHYAD